MFSLGLSLLIVQWSGSLETLYHFNNIRMYVLTITKHRSGIPSESAVVLYITLSK